MSYTGHVVELRFQGGTSNKFYRIYRIVDVHAGMYYVLLNWGRWGATGQFKTETFSDEEGMRFFGTRKIAEKLAKGYEHIRETELPIVPADLLDRLSANLPTDVTPEVAAVDLFASFAGDADRLVRMVTGPAELSADAVVLHADLKSRLAELSRRLEESTGQLEFIEDIITMKANA
jgi:predicted DNA-binding WGR domain protein